MFTAFALREVVNHRLLFPSTKLTTDNIGGRNTDPSVVPGSTPRNAQGHPIDWASPGRSLGPSPATPITGQRPSEPKISVPVAPSDTQPYPGTPRV